jgi:dipeptidyl aminopeptidase/acylaminoacyl peptidase
MVHLCMQPGVEAAQRRLLAPADALETVRLMDNPDAISPQNPQGAVAISPDGKRYVARLIRGDAKRNGVWVDLIAGRPDSLERSARHEVVARLFTTGLGSANSLFGAIEDTNPHSTPLRWIDDDRIVFLWSNERGIRQLVRLTLSTRRLEYLTDHPTHLVTFDISSNGTVFYSAQARPGSSAAAALALLQQGFVVDDDTDASSLFHRHIGGGNGYDRAWNTEWFLLDGPNAVPRRLAIGGRDVALDYRHRIAFSPDGKVALVNAGVSEVPPEWEKYTGQDPAAWVAEARRDSHATTARVVHKLFVVDVEQGTSRPLWDALSLIYVAGAAWSPDGRALLVAPTFLPVQTADARGLAGRAAAVVDVATGQYEQLPIELPEMQLVASLHWLDANTVQISQRDGLVLKHHRFVKVRGRWQATQQDAISDAATVPLRFEVRQDLNTPPRVFAVEVATGRERLLFDPNPGLTGNFVLGRVTRLEGALPTGEQWEGVLFYPADYPANKRGVRKRYPLVIQSQYGAVATGFTLYGFGSLGPAEVASYPGQLLANRGIAVLQLNVRMGAKFNTAQEAETRKVAFERAAEQLVESGLVDRRKVGLAGYSRNGYYVEYTLTHSSFPFATAISADSWDPGYFQQTLTGDIGNASAVNGALPFGEGLKTLLQSTPGFNVEKIRTPLRMIEQSNGLFGVLAKWEVFARLRYLKKPVEFYVVPDSEHGSHATQNPAQILAIQQGSVDWFDFWLNGHEDPSPHKAQQYERWRTLRKLHEMDLQQNAAAESDNRAQ